MSFESVENGLALGPGHPTLVYFCKDTELAVEVCAVPMVGMDIDSPNTLSFPVLVHSQTPILTSLVSIVVRDVLDTFNMTFLIHGMSSDDSEHFEFRIAVDVEPIIVDGTHHYSALAHVTVEPYVVKRAVEMLRKQIEAHSRIEELHNTAYMQSTSKH